MAAVDDFAVVFRGNGCHAAMPHLGDDPILAAASFVTAIQRVVSRSVDPLAPAVLSVTQIHGGRFNNFVPGEVKVEGTCRFYDKALSDHCAAEIERVASSHRLDAWRQGGARLQARLSAGGESREWRCAWPRPPPRMRSAREHVLTEFQPSMGCEDFAFMLQGVGDGAYAWIGAGDVGPGEGLHGDRFVFNDAVIPIGIRFFLSIVQRSLPRKGGAPR